MCTCHCCLLGQCKRKCRLLAVVATNKATAISENGKHVGENKANMGFVSCTAKESEFDTLKVSLPDDVVTREVCAHDEGK